MFWPKHFKNTYKNVFKKGVTWDFLGGQWLRLCAPNARGVGKSFVRASATLEMVGKKQVKSRRAMKSDSSMSVGLGRSLKAMRYRWQAKIWS